MEREVARGGEREAKALAGAGRGVGERSEAGPRRQRGAPSSRTGERKHASHVERARGGVAGTCYCAGPEGSHSLRARLERRHGQPRASEG